MPKIYYEFDENTGFYEKVECDQLPGGRFRLVDGVWFRIGEARAIPDRPYSTTPFNYGNGIKNPVDGKTYYDVNSFEDAVKRSGSKIVGNDAQIAPAKKEIQGDFNLRQELTQATRQVLAKQ